MLVCLITSCESQRFDTIIRGGTVFDGTGKDGMVTDIGINADTISFIGDLSSLAYTWNL